MAYSTSNVEYSVPIASLFARDSNCLDCPPTQPSCGSCPSGQVCSLIPQSCQKCAHTECVPSGITTGSGKSSGPNVSAIAGGVVGGVAFVVLVTIAIWWFFIRPRKQDMDYEEDWNDDEYNARKSQFEAQRDDRRSVHSVASTVLSRASNMIPIAFIPGVTNRDGNMPPVPPIPAARSYAPSPLSSGNGQGAIFFSAGDLRNSSYSDTSSINNRDTFVGRPSITPSLARESVASEVYRDHARENPMPAQTILRARPNMVSVKTQASSTKSSPSPLGTAVATPLDVSDRDYEQSQNQTAGFAKPKPVTIAKKASTGRFPIKAGSGTSTPKSKATYSSPLANTDVDTTDDEDEDPHSRARKSLLQGKQPRLATDTSSGLMQNPFTDESADESPVTAKPSHNRGISDVIKEATRRASILPKHSGLGGRKDSAKKASDEE